MAKDNLNKYYVLGIDIGGTKIAVCLANAAGKVLGNERTSMCEYSKALPKIVTMAKKLVADAGLKMSDIKCCGVSAPGPLDMKNGRIMKSPNMLWDNEPIVADVAKKLKVNVVLENDANAGVLAEWFFGGAKGKKDIVYLTMSTGVGAGVVCGGKLVTGADGLAGELGHVVLDVNGPLCGCGLRGCVEAYCGGRSVARRLQDMLRYRPDHAMFRLPEVDGKLENLTFQAVREGAKAGIPLAVEMWDEICMRLAQCIALCHMAYNPEQIILGTAAYYAGDFLLEPVKRYLPRFTWSAMNCNCEICVSKLGLKIGELAGASVALNDLHNQGLI